MRVCVCVCVDGLANDPANRSAGMRADWDMSEAGAAEAWDQFTRVNLAKYEDDHGRTDAVPAAVSRLSPYLKFGQLSPRRVYHELSTKKMGDGGVEGRRLSRLFWHRLYRREFAYWQLHNWPELSVRSVRTHYEGREDWDYWIPAQPLRDDAGSKKMIDSSAVAAAAVAATAADDDDAAAPVDHERGEETGTTGTMVAGTGMTGREALHRWQTGTTGFPVVDAGMRRLWATGWMHQTERMIAATFLVDYCGVHWTHGARWFHDTLVDADLAGPVGTVSTPAHSRSFALESRGAFDLLELRGGARLRGIYTRRGLFARRPITFVYFDGDPIRFVYSPRLERRRSTEVYTHAHAVVVYTVQRHRVGARLGTETTSEKAQSAVRVV